MMLLVFSANTGFAQPITCGDLSLQVNNNNPAVPLEANCDYNPIPANEDCFLLSFPVFFTYTGSNPNPPSSFIVDALTITGNITGSANIYVDEVNTERCESQNLTMEFDPSDNSFEVTAGSASLEFSPALGGEVAFWIFVEARPFEFVDIDFTEIMVTLPNGGGTCTLPMPTVGTTVQQVAGNCELTDLSLELETSVPTDVSLNIINNTIGVQVGRLDGMVKVTDTYGNLGDIYGSGIQVMNPFIGIIVSPTVSIGNEHFIYFEYNPTGAAGLSSNSSIPVIEINISEPDITNAGGEAIVELLWSRWKMEDSNAAECCQPTLDTPKTLTFEGELPCDSSPDVTFSVQPANNQLPNLAGCEGQLQMHVFAHNVTNVSFSIVEIEVDFEIKALHTDMFT